MLTLDELASALRITRRSLDRRRQLGLLKLTEHRRDGRPAFDPTELADYLRECRERGDKP